MLRRTSMECVACHHPNEDGARFCRKCGAPLPQQEEKDALIGTLVGGRFQITAILGEGGMGRVYTAEQQMGTKKRKVAVKTIVAEYAKDPQVVARFMREGGVVSELEHPNTIKFYDFGKTDAGDLYVAMEFLDGQTLESLLEKRDEPLERQRTLREQAIERRPAYQLHRDPEQSVVLGAEGVDVSSVRVVELRREPCFAQEALGHVDGAP